MTPEVPFIVAFPFHGKVDKKELAILMVGGMLQAQEEAAISCVSSLIVWRWEEAFKPQLVQTLIVFAFFVGRVPIRLQTGMCL